MRLEGPGTGYDPFRQRGSTLVLSAGEKKRLFEGHALFGILAPEDVLLARARFEHYPAGNLIFAKGSPGRSMMAVLRGLKQKSYGFGEGSPPTRD